MNEPPRSPVASVTVNIDRTAPVLTAGSPPVKAHQDDEDNWRVPLSGTVTAGEYITATATDTAGEIGDRAATPIPISSLGRRPI